MILSKAYFLISLHRFNLGILSHKRSCLEMSCICSLSNFCYKTKLTWYYNFSHKQIHESWIADNRPEEEKAPPNITHPSDNIFIDIGLAKLFSWIFWGPDIAFLCNVEEHQEFPFSHSPPIYSFSFRGKHFFDHSDKRFFNKNQIQVTKVTI